MFFYFLARPSDTFGGPYFRGGGSPRILAWVIFDWNPVSLNNASAEWSAVCERRKKKNRAPKMLAPEKFANRRALPI